MAKLSSMLGGNYLKGTDFEPNQRIRLIIDSFGEDTMPDGELRKVLHFQNSKKSLVLNATNLNRLIDLFTDCDEAALRGQAVELYVDPTVEFGGKRVGGIRIFVPPFVPGEAAPAPTPAPAAAAAPDDPFGPTASDPNAPPLDDDPFAP